MQSIVIVVVATLLGAAAVGAGSTLTGPRYTSEAQILWDPAALEYLGATAPSNSEVLDRQVVDQQQVVTSDRIVEEAAQPLGMDAEELREAVSVEAQPNSSLITITGAADEPDEAAALTTSLTTAYVDHVQTSGAEALREQADLLQPTIDRLTAERAALEAELAGLNAQLSTTPVTSALYGILSARADRLGTLNADVSNRLADLVAQGETLRGTAESFPGQAFVVRQPTVPEAPSSPSLVTALVLGAAIGFFIGVCIVFFVLGRRAGPMLGPATGHPAT